MSSVRPGSRYQIQESLGQGGMGEVYSALDRRSDPPREVALKTIRDASDPTAVELFKRECSVLMSFNHPNVIELYDTGDLDEGGVTKPYFVMARLRGKTLDQLIKDSPQHLTVERTIEIIYQVSRGLQAAHDHGLVHRDIKPSNIFVLEDDSVKVIDFGVAHLLSAQTVGVKGTLFYMAPEQFEGKPVTPMTDVFSLGAVCFEALTRRRPFAGNTPDEIRKAILTHIPAPASTLNPAVNASLNQVIHAAMAKKPLHRFSSAREFGEALKKALRNETIERFQPEKLQIRLSRVQAALDSSQYEIADEILGQLEDEGYLHPSVTELRRQVNLALRNRHIRQFLESARRFLDQEEYTLALQKVQDALELDDSNTETQDLRAQIESKRSAEQIGNWLNLAQKHLNNCAFKQAREAASSVLRVQPTDVQALRLMKEIDRVEQEVARKLQEKGRFFDSAVELRNKGDLTAALSRLERVMQLDREAPEILMPEKGAEYQKFYNEVRSEFETIRKSLDEAKAHVAARNYAAGEAICDDFLQKYPNHALFQALKYDIGEQQRQDLSAYIAEIDRESDCEPDLARKAKILEEALSRYPGEVHFERALKGVNARRDLINGLVSQAGNLEERGQYSEAIDKWEMVRSIYKQYPGLDIEVDRIRTRHAQQARSEAKSRWIERIDGAVNSGDYNRALDQSKQALAEFPNDPQLLPLERLAREQVEQSEGAQRLLEQAHKLHEQNLHDEAIAALRQAHALDERNSVIRAVYIEELLDAASTFVNTDIDQADRLTQTAFGLDATNARIKSMRVIIADTKRSKAVDQWLSKAREMQACGDLEGAFNETKKGLVAHPGDPRLLQLEAALFRILEGSHKESELRRDRGKMLQLRQDLDQASDLETILPSLFEESLVLARKHPGDEQIQAVASEISEMQSRKIEEPRLPQAVDGTFVVGKDPSAPLYPDFSIFRWRDAAADAVAPRIQSVKNTVVQVPPRVWKYSVAAVVVLAVVTAGILLATRGRRSTAVKTSPPPISFKLKFNITPADATVRESNQAPTQNHEFELTPGGEHSFEISRTGYETQVIKISGPGDPAPVVLSPLPTLLDISRGSAVVALDKQVLDDLNLQQKLSPAEEAHSIEISNGLNGKASLTFVAKAGAEPSLKEVPQFQNILALVAVSFGDHARLFGSSKIQLDGQEVMVPAEGAEIKLPHEVSFSDGKQTYSFQIATSESPLISLIVPDPGQGQIKVTSNEDDTEIMLRDSTGKEVSRGKVRKSRSISLKPGDYFIRGVKDRFADDGPRKVTVTAGKIVNVDLKLQPKFAVLVVGDAPEGASVLLGSDKLGSIENGTFRAEKLNPGTYSVTITAPHTEASAQTATLNAGQTTTLSWKNRFYKTGDVTLVCNVPQCTVTYTLRGQQEKSSIGVGTHTLPEGYYSFIADAPDHTSDSSGEVQLRSDAPQNVSLSPKAISTSKPGNKSSADDVVHLTANDLTPACQPQNGILECKKGTGLNAKLGTYSFEVTNRNPEWTILFADQKRIEFSLTDKSFTTDPKNIGGMKKRTVTFDLGGPATLYKVQIDTSTGTTTVTANGKFFRSTWEVPSGQTLSPSRFEFRNPNRVAAFSFDGKR